MTTQLNTVKKSNISKIIFLTFITLLTVFLSYFAYTQTSVQMRFIKNSTQSSGKVVSLSESKNSDNRIMYSPVVEYTNRDGEIQTFTSALSSNPPGYEIGDPIEILIPNDNSIPQVNSFMSLWMASIILSIFTLVCLCVLTLSIYSSIYNSRTHKQLMKEGIKIQAKVMSVAESTYSKESTLSWAIYAQWLNPQDNLVYNFDSADIYYNPKEFVGDTIDVLILPQNPKVYEMDISKLPASA
ncbi:MAG: DUF3592 domain-containing protein [Patescibacteria group bacterium]